MKRNYDFQADVGLLGLASMTYAWQVKIHRYPGAFITLLLQQTGLGDARPRVELSLPKGSVFDVFMLRGSKSRVSCCQNQARKSR
jgi:hypothetical protein